MKYIFALLFFVSSTTFAAMTKEEACEVKKNKKLEMNVIAFNIANFFTTHTPEGGPYKRQRFVCENHICDIVKSDEFDLEYEPDHPDADTTGFVKYPHIDREEEMQAMLAASREHDEAAKLCP